MRLAILAAFAAIPFVCVPVQAKDGHTVVVKSSLTPLALWSNTMTRNINDHLVYPYDLSGRSMEGLTSIAFQCGGDGRPVGMQVVRKSGETRLDRAAMHAISSVRTMFPLPPNIASNQRFVANILFASTQQEYDRQLRQLRKAAEQRNRWAMAGGGEVLTLVVTPNPHG